MRDEQAKRLESAARALDGLLSEIDFENGHVSWTREMSIAHQRLEEVVMWAIKAIDLSRRGSQ